MAHFHTFALDPANGRDIQWLRASLDRLCDGAWHFTSGGTAGREQRVAFSSERDMTELPSRLYLDVV